MFSENMVSAKALEYLNRAKELAQAQGDTKVDTDHLLFVMLSDEKSALRKVCPEEVFGKKRYRTEGVFKEGGGLSAKGEVPA